ncbi:OTU domain-containing protein [Corallococcus exercitus]|uniref:OTU domain-containing protein n=1 Tax=Corallococcus exercitus TaxID=2316736 RepID=UPI0035D44408
MATKKQRLKQKKVERAKNYQERMEQRQLDARIGPRKREVAIMPAVQAERDLTAAVFGGDAEAYAAFEQEVSLPAVLRLHRVFGGRAGVSVLAGVIEDVCHGDAGTFAELLQGLGSERALRHMLVVFNGDTTLISMLLTRLGTTGAFTDAFKQQVEEREKVRREQGEGNLPSIAGRVERFATEARTKLALAQAQAAQKAQNIQHPVVQNLMREWYARQAELEDLLRSGKPSVQALTGAIVTLNDFLQGAERVRATVEQEWFHWIKFRDSKAKIDELIRVAKQKHTDIAGELMTRSGPMPFPQQRMVPSAKDLEAVQARMNQDKALRTPSQAWALVAAERKGAFEKAFARVKALQRMADLNAKWGTDYDEEDFERILQHLVQLRLVTNYTFAKKPGDNLDQRKNKPVGTPLKDLLMSSTTFKQVWETGASQASTDLTKRGAVEEQMGYAFALKRTQGRFQDYNDATSRFAPTDGAQMPKYAALVSPTQKHGVAQRYGKSYVIWKDALHERMTHTPGDSWNQLDQGVKHFTSPNHPEMLFAHTDEPIIRLAAAEATGKDAAWLKKQRASGAEFGGPYIETQLHGDLTWKDVATIVVGDDEEDAEAMVEQFRAFAKKHGHDFLVRGKGERGAVPMGGRKAPFVPRAVEVSVDKGDMPKPSSRSAQRQVSAGHGYFLTSAQAARLARAGRQNVAIAPDGDCLFASLIRVGAYAGSVMRLRQLVADRVANGRIDISAFNLDPRQTAADIRRLGSYNNLAGDATPSLLANALGINILIYNPDGSTTTLDSGSARTFHVIRFLAPAAHYHATAPL